MLIISQALLWSAPRSVASDDDTIVVRGQRRETRKLRQNGQTLHIRPADASRFESNTHLKRESSLLTPDSGRSNASGFAVPQIRGQDAKLTEVYLEDTLLHDPYSGLPMSEELDLRAFGSMEVQQGLPPADLAGVNPIGSLRFRFHSQAPTAFSLGLQAGRPYGRSQWALGHYRSADHMQGQSTVARLYARQHDSDGRYEYYSDEGTPYNTSDDTLRHRQNNQQSSSQLLPMLQHKIGPYTIQALAWTYRREQGLASPSPHLASQAHLLSRGQMSSLRLDRQSKFVALPGAWGLHLGVSSNDDRRQLADPDQQFIVTAARSDLLVRSERADAKLSLTLHDVKLALAYESSKARVQSTLGERFAADLERLTYGSHLGLSFSPAGKATIELKGSQRAQHATPAKLASAYVLQPAPDDESPQQQNAEGGGLSLALHPSKRWTLYAQAARSKRLPSLMEEFGDGSALRGNSQLQPESTRHHELGLSWQTAHAAAVLATSFYSDETADKIVLVPVVAGSLKALNVHRTTIRGWDSRVELTRATTSIMASLTRLWAYNTNRSHHHRQLPGIPAQVFTSELTQHWSVWTLRWLARYRSAVYRDLANSVELPGAWQHDCSADLKLHMPQRGTLHLGLSVRNALNVMAVPIKAVASSQNQGMTAWSDIAGAPLPGRHWILSLALTI